MNRFNSDLWGLQAKKKAFGMEIVKVQGLMYFSHYSEL
jgi:hypothetical protein